MRSDARVPLPETQHAQQQPRRSNEIKCPAPAEVSANQSTDHIAERAADWNRRAKNRHDATPLFDREKVGQDCRRRGSVAAFANSNANSSCKKNRECCRETGAAAGQAPQNHSTADNNPPGESIGEQTENRGADHVSNEKRVAQQTSLRHRVHVARCKKSFANIGLERGQNLPVDVVEKIDSQEQKECATGAAQRTFRNRFHQYLPIAVCRTPIVNDKRCLPCPPLNACSIFSAGCWCVAFIACLGWDWKTCPQVDFYFCRTTSHGLMPSSCSSLARAQFATSLTRSIIINRFYTRFCARWVAFQSIFGIRVPPFVLRLKKLLKARSSVFFPTARWNAPGFFCDCSAVRN